MGIMELKLTGAQHKPASWRTLATLLIVAALFPAFSRGAEEASVYGGEVTVPLLNQLEGFHPLVDRALEAVVLQLLYNGLVKLNERLEPIPDLAESWGISADGLTWEFRLRSGVLFHDGEEMTSEDVTYTLNEILSGRANYAVSPLFANIESVSGLGHYTVQIALKQPFAPLLHLLTVEILPSHMLTGSPESLEEFRQNPVGTGPFTFAQREGDTITLNAFDQYFEGRPFLDSVKLRYLPDKKRAWAELMQGNLSIVPDLDPEDYEVIRQDTRFSAYSNLDVFYHTVLINNDDPLLSNKAIRVALSLAIDTEEIIDKALGGWADPTSGPFIPGTWPYDESVPANQFDPGAAGEMLAQEGWADTDGDSILEKDGQEFAISLLIDEGDALKEALAQTIKWQLFRIGVRVEVEYLDSRELLQTRLFPGKYQIALLQFNAAGDPDTFTYLFWHSSRIGASNLARYQNHEVDLLLEQGRSEYDFEKRRSIYHDIHRIMVEDAASIFLFARRLYTGATSRIEGLEGQPQLLFKSARDWKITAQ